MTTKAKRTRPPGGACGDHLTAANAAPRRPKSKAARSKAAGRRLVLEAQAQADLLTAANAALRELGRLDGLGAIVRPGAHLGLRSALHALDALDEGGDAELWGAGRPAREPEFAPCDGCGHIHNESLCPRCEGDGEEDCCAPQG